MIISTDVLLYALIGLTVLLGALVVHLEIKVTRLLKGKDAKSLEDLIHAIKAELKTEQKFKKEMEEYLVEVEKRLQKSLRGVETVRFNPFKGTGSGGNQSFATAFVDERGDGVVISSLYARDRMSVFSKPIKKYSSEFDLTEEEQKAVEGAKKATESY
ncbi:MAG TPA: DUF4446 family protein [Candidatus Paceibacterota bacterium]